MITGPQLRAARGYLDWTRAQCAVAAGISPETVKNIEKGSFNAGPKTVEALIKCFGDKGIELTEGDGVRKIPTCKKCGEVVNGEEK